MSAANKDDELGDLAQAQSLMSAEEIALAAGDDDSGEDQPSEELDLDADDTSTDADDAGEDDADDDEGDEGDAPAAAPAAALAAAPAAADAADAVAAVVDDDEDDELPPPVYKSELPADFKERVKAAEEKEAKADDDYENGDIDREEHRRLTREARAEQRELDRLQTKADTAREMAEQAELQVMHRAAFKVFDAAKQVGIDYTKDAGKMGELRAFADVVERANPGKPPGWILREAHKRVLVANDMAAPTAKAPAPAPAAPAPKVDAKAEAVSRRKPQLDKAQPSLAQVPGGDGPGDVGSEYADIESLDGEAYEAALERLRKSNPTRFNAYMEAR